MRKAAAVVIPLALCVVLSAFPVEVSAKGRTGAMIVVTRLDGTILAGELIAIKTDSLLLLAPSAADLSVPLRDIRTVQIVRKSKAGTFILVGGVAGMVGMGGYVLAYADSDVVGSKTGAAVLYGLLAGAAGAAAGAILGSAAGADSVFIVAGQPPAVVADFWARLAARSRMGRMPGPGAGTGGARGRARRPRFRLSAAGHFPTGRGSRFGAAGSFRFPEETGPEAGPYPLSLQGYTGAEDRGLRLGPFGIACDWRERWAAEIEFMPVRAGYNYVGGEMTFTSSLDGLPYWSDLFCQYSVDCYAVLAGVSYRPVAPSALQRHAVEAGLAAGPAFLSLKNQGEDLFLLPTVRKTALCARVRAAYDFQVAPAFSVGAFAGYRYLETSFDALEGSALCTFWATAEPYPASDRPTVAALPDLPLKASGFYWGLRVSFRL